MADVIGAHRVELRQWLVLDLIRRQSFGAGRTEAYIPSLKHFEKALGISKGNVSSILKDVKERLVIEEIPEFYYGFRFPVEEWKLPVRLEQMEVINQLALIEAPRLLQNGMREHFIEQCRQGKPGLPGLSYVRDQQSPPTRPLSDTLKNGVPDLGTPSFSESGSRIGNGQKSLILAGVSSIVPESGTAHAYMQQCSNALPKHDLSIAACGSVPESGTPLPEQPGRAKQLNEEQQRLFDELGQVGAYGKNRNDPSRPCWFGMVSARPSVVAELLGDLKHVMRTRPGHIKTPGAWMMTRWQQWGKPNR